ncbi:hypothetical protein NPIL_183151 [Nephila pilipes]|uniref:Uncharacterized protein n=1 Tax=Nephila pilipes TaxID=299642 RepID=A0A8X6Q561_NEPPI|nr:hypothetical protein NPIL_183151 [Nephila pilipes]
MNDYKIGNFSAVQKVNESITASKSNERITYGTKEQKIRSPKRKILVKNIVPSESNHKSKIIKPESEASNPKCKFFEINMNKYKKKELEITSVNHENLKNNLVDESQPVIKKLKRNVSVSTGTLSHDNDNTHDVKHNDVLFDKNSKDAGDRNVDSTNDIYKAFSFHDHIEKFVDKRENESNVLNSYEDIEKVNELHAVNNMHEIAKNTFGISNMNSSSQEHLLRCNIVHDCIIEILNAASLNSLETDIHGDKDNSKCDFNCKTCLQVIDTLPVIEATLLSKPKKNEGPSCEIDSKQSKFMKEDVRSDSNNKFITSVPSFDRTNNATLPSNFQIVGNGKNMTQIFACSVKDAKYQNESFSENICNSSTNLKQFHSPEVNRANNFLHIKSETNSQRPLQIDCFASNANTGLATNVDLKFFESPSNNSTSQDIPNTQFSKSEIKNNFDINNFGNASSELFINYCKKFPHKNIEVPLFPDKCKACKRPLLFQYCDLPIHKEKLVFPDNIFSLLLSCKLCGEKHSLDKDNMAVGIDSLGHPTP